MNMGLVKASSGRIQAYKRGGRALKGVHVKGEAEEGLGQDQ